MGAAMSLGRMLAARFSKQNVRLLMVGLDAAGKTTILYKLKLNEVVTTLPTIGFNIETVEHRHLRMTVWDIGGQDKLRPLWRFYMRDCDGVIFVVDSNDRDRVGQAREELQRLLATEELRDACLLVLANKQDLPYAMTLPEVTDRLCLRSIARNRDWYAQGSCAVSGEGLHQGLDWLAEACKRAAAQRRQRAAAERKERK
eukprot:TRINITY_DN1954_c0_g1_i1.p2 TRINITY_DN1954_c0_g1~~TRINITY_DN1954_c0_g1_i1.p2  ORF type:complete len:226 (+),score=96.87 TRINITY_DN1954_c0_g1_i1:80-679(+)